MVYFPKPNDDAGKRNIPKRNFRYFLDEEHWLNQYEFTATNNFGQLYKMYNFAFSTVLENIFLNLFLVLCKMQCR